MADVTVTGFNPDRGVVRMGHLEVSGLDPRHETPLFAAGVEFALETSGPIAREFLDKLPENWRQGNLVIDSTLVWLGRGYRQGEMIWCHEPFPGRTDGAPGQSNAQQAAEHIACCFGPAGIDFLQGEAAEEELAHAPHTPEGLRERHTLLQTKIDGGHLSIEAIPPFAMYRYRWGAFHRHQVAVSSGFHFWIRATRGDCRPLVNGIRNATNL